MPKKRKEPTFYAVKRPDGTLMPSTVSDHEFISLNRAWNENEIATSAWIIAEFKKEAVKLGYRVVKVKIVEVE